MGDRHMSPQELYESLDTRRRARAEPWWRIALALDTSLSNLQRMKTGDLSDDLRVRVEALLAQTEPT
jgi:hypothetical protein